MEKIEHEMCPFCHTKNLTLTQDEVDIPFFGKTYVFAMDCTNCKYHKSDVESAEIKDPVRITFTVESEKDLNVRVVRSSTASVKIPQMRMDVRPGPASDGEVTNIEGVINKFEKIIKQEAEDAEDDDVKKHAKNLLKKFWKVKLGDIPLKIVIEDPTGNSAIISDKAVIEKLKAVK